MLLKTVLKVKQFGKNTFIKSYILEKLETSHNFTNRNFLETFRMKYTFGVYCLVVFWNFSASNAKFKHLKAFNEMRIGLEVIKRTIKNNAEVKKV